MADKVHDFALLYSEVAHGFVNMQNHMAKTSHDADDYNACLGYSKKLLVTQCADQAQQEAFPQASVVSRLKHLVSTLEASKGATPIRVWPFSHHQPGGRGSFQGQVSLV